MRILGLALVLLAMSGCGGSDDGPPAAAGSPVLRNADFDPVFAEYRYPGSKIDYAFHTSSSVQLTYRVEDPFAEVVRFYQQRFDRQTEPEQEPAIFGKPTSSGAFTIHISGAQGPGCQILMTLSQSPHRASGESSMAGRQGGTTVK